MSLSQTAYQYRDRQSRLSNPILLWGVVGSVVAHGGLLPIFLWLGQQSPLPQPARIEIIVTEPPPPEEEEPEPAQLSDRLLDEAPVDEPFPLEPALEAAPTAALLPPDTPPEPVDSPPETVDDEIDEPVEPVEEELAVDQPDAPDEESPDPEASEAEVNEAVESEPVASATEADAERDNPRASITSRANTSARRSTQALGDRLRGRAPSTSRSQGSDRPGPPAETQAARPESTGSAAQDSGGGGSRTVACQHCPSPSYPQSALDANVEGTVGIMVDISPGGAVAYANVVSSSGSSALDQAALSTVRGEWRFQPISGGANGVMVSVVMTISGSDLNRRAQEQGNRESVDLPSEPESAESTADVEPDERQDERQDEPDQRQDEDNSAESTTELLPSEPPPEDDPPTPEDPAVEPPEAVSLPEDVPADPPPMDPVPDPSAPVEPPPEPVAPEVPPVEVSPSPEQGEALE